MSRRTALYQKGLGYRMAELRWDHLTVGEINALAAQDAIVLLPVASTEQHGPHLATGVDTILCAEACHRTAQRLSAVTPVMVAPCVWMGLAEHHVKLGGTFTVSLKTWAALLEDVLDSIIRAGFKRICVVNGHGGNMAALATLTTEIAKNLGTPIVTTSYWKLPQANGAFADILETQTGVQHACEAETSMMMAARPDLVKMPKIPSKPMAQMSMADAIGADLMIWKSFEEIAPNGVLGDAAKATAEKGEALLNAAAEHLADALQCGAVWGATFTDNRTESRHDR